MRDIRFARQCHRDGCDSEACWRLHLQVECVGTVVAKERIRLRAPTSIRVCNDKQHHKAALEYLMSDGNKSRIVAGLLANGFPAPDWSSATAIFEPLSDAALEPMEAA